MTTALQPRPGALALTEPKWGMTRDQIDLVKRTIAKGATDDEFELFMSTAQRMQLDPIAKQIYAVKRHDRRENRDVMSIQVSIDGYRVCAMRSGQMDGEDGPYWCGPDGVWVDAWLHQEAPRAAKFVVYRKGCAHPFVGVAAYDSFVQLKDGKPNSMWERGPDFMLAKCAEAVAKRRAFPLELHGTVTPEEAGDDAIEVEFRTVETAAPVVQPRALPAPSKPTIPIVATSVDGTEREPVPAQNVARQAGEDAAREQALAKARANAAELERPRAPEPEQTTRPATTGALTEDELAAVVCDMYQAPHLGALKTLLHQIIKRKTTKEQRDQLDAAYVVAEKKIKAAAQGST